MGITCNFHGFVTADAERRTSAAGRSWVRLRVGVGEGKRVQSIRIVVLGGALEVAAILKRGDRIQVEGRLSLDKWRDKDGVERYSLSVVASKIEKPLRHKRPRRRPSQYNSVLRCAAMSITPANR